MIKEQSYEEFSENCDRWDADIKRELMIKEQLLFGTSLILLVLVFSWFAAEVIPSDDIHIVQLPSGTAKGELHSVKLPR